MQKLLLLVVCSYVLLLPTIKANGEKTCGPPPTVEFARTDVKNNEYTEGTVVTYNCEFGYVTHGSSRSITCVVKQLRGSSQQLADPDWTQLDFSCIPRSCGHPGYVENGIRVGSLFTFPNRVSFECEEGYQLRGTSVRYCLASGTWSGRLPTCEITFCDAPKNPDRGRVSFTSLEYGSELKYVCDSGYVVNETQTRFCLPNGTWSGNEPSCVEARCEFPAAPKFGSADLSGGVPSIGSLVTYSCDGDRFLVGSPRSKCLENGQWMFPTPECLKQCSIPEVPHGEIGRYRYSSFRKIKVDEEVQDEEELFLRCDAGYDPLGSNNWQKKLSCKKGRWSDTPRCEEAACREDPLQADNAVPILSGIKHGTILAYECDEGFVKKKQENVTCHFGEWRGSLPICGDTRCSVEDVIFTGLQKPSKRHYNTGESFQPSCSKGFKLIRVRDSRLMCDIGQWKGHLPPCKADSCPEDLPSISHGQGSAKTNAHGSKANYSCDRFYAPVGGTIVQCTLGKWTGQPPTCIDTRCYSKELKRGTGISSDTDQGTPSGEQLEVKCEEGYFRNRIMSPRCYNGEWSESTYSPCTEENCIVPRIRNGAITEEASVRDGFNFWKARFNWKTVYNQVDLGYRAEPGFQLFLSCDEGYTFRGRGENNVPLICKEGRWAPLPMCLITGTKYEDEIPKERKPTERPVPEDKITDSSKDIQPSTTEKGFPVPDGDSSNERPHFPGERDPSVCFCEFVNFDPGLVAYVDQVRLRSRDRVQKGSTVKFQCKEFGIFRMRGNSEITCETCQSWHSSEFPTCLDPVAGDAIIIFDDNVKVTPDSALEIEKGQKVRFSCIAVGVEEYPLWRVPNEEGVEIKNEIYDQRGQMQYISYLDLEYAEPENDGKYQCSVPGFTLNVVDVHVIDPTVLCPKFEENDSLLVYYNKKRTVNSKAAFHCLKLGQEVQGPSEVTCLSNGSWSDGPPECVDATSDLRCPKLKETETMQISYSKHLNVNSVATFRCVQTSKINGVSHVTCLESGMWSDSIPSCDLQSSPCRVDSLKSALPSGVIPYDEDVTEESMPHGSLLRLKCKDDTLAAIGNTTAKCGLQEIWEFDRIQCVEGCLPAEIEPDSLLVIDPMKDIYEFGEFISLSCPPGKLLTPDTIRAVCFQGKWIDDQFPVCIDEE